MITTVLAIFTVQAALGQEPPQIISTHKTYAECQNAKQKLLHEKWQEMQKITTFQACLRVVFEYAGSEHLKETKKGEGSD